VTIGQGKSWATTSIRRRGGASPSSTTLV
jgi:hypothetical protein